MFSETGYEKRTAGAGFQLLQDEVAGILINLICVHLVQSLRELFYTSLSIIIR